MKVADVVRSMNRIAPARFAEPWDNVGLLVGDPDAEASRGLLTIDYTDEVERERASIGADFVIAYHPPLFEATKRFVAGSRAFHAARCGVAVYSPHTSWDVADGGVNDILADILGMEESSPLRDVETPDDEYKLVTFVPHADVERVAAALFEAGAGRIGNYRECSFRSEGTGTFFGGDGAAPRVGEAGRRESVAEVRLECVVPKAQAGEIVRALRAVHPYEEPAFDLGRLASRSVSRGVGRIGRIATTSRPELFQKIKAALSVNELLVAGPLEGVVGVAAVCAGSGGDLLRAAVAKGADLFLTGELRHHDALRAAPCGMTVVCALHSRSERLSLGPMREKLIPLLPGVPLHIAASDRDPFSVV